MVDMIKFLTDKFNQSEDNIMKELTDNIIIICDSLETKSIISETLYNGGVEEKENFVGFHWVNCKDDINCELLMDFPQTSIFEMSDGDFIQKITITVENAFVFQTKNLYDLWFASLWKGKISFDALTYYKDYEKFDNSPIMLYKALSVGRFSIDGKYGR